MLPVGDLLLKGGRSSCPSPTSPAQVKQRLASVARGGPGTTISTLWHVSKLGKPLVSFGITCLFSNGQKKFRFAVTHTTPVCGNWSCKSRCASPSTAVLCDWNSPWLVSDTHLFQVLPILPESMGQRMSFRKGKTLNHLLLLRIRIKVIYKVEHLEKETFGFTSALGILIDHGKKRTPGKKQTNLSLLFK